jgi:YesN/AraC family two-component response regulator
MSTFFVIPALQPIVNVAPRFADIKLVAEATNGQEAIEKFRSQRPDVTLMDLQMPARNGLDAIIGIRSEFPNARIIVLKSTLAMSKCCGL